MTPQRLQEYKAKVAGFRQRLGIQLQLRVATRAKQTVDSTLAGTALSSLFLLGENLLYALLPPPATHLKPAVEGGYAIAASGGEDTEISFLHIPVDGLHHEVRPDAYPGHHHDDLEGNSLVLLCPLSSILRPHWSLRLLRYDLLSLTEAWGIVKTTTVQKRTRGYLSPVVEPSKWAVMTGG